MNKMKKFLSVCLALVVLIGVFSFFAPAATTLTADDYISGNDVVIDFVLNDALEMNRANLTFSYDKNVFTCKSLSYFGTRAESYITSQLALNIMFYTPNTATAGQAKLTMSFLNCIEADSGQGSTFNFARLILTVKSGKEAQVEGSPITISGSTDGFRGYTSINRTYYLTSSFVSGTTMGDIDGDNVVSAADARFVLRASVGLDELSEDQMIYANMDYDSSISSSDARLILRTSVGLERAERHTFEPYGKYYRCSECYKQFHFHKYEHYDCYSSKRCFCGAENGELAGHRVNILTRKCNSCGKDIEALIRSAYNSLNSLYSIEELRNLATTAYNKKDYAASALYSYEAADVFAVITVELNKDKDFNEVHKCFAGGAIIMRDTLLALQPEGNILPVDQKSAEMLLKALNDCKPYEEKTMKALVNMLEPYKSMLKDLGITLPF